MSQTYPIVNMAAGHIFAQNNRTETNRYFGWIQPWHNYETFNIIQLVSMFIGPAAWNMFLCVYNMYIGVCGCAVSRWLISAVC